MGNRKNKSRSQKRKFIGNRFTERTKPLDVPTFVWGNENNWKRPFIFEETVCQFEHSFTVKLSKSAYRSCEKKLLNVASVVSKNAMIEAADEVRKLKNTSDVAECGVSVDDKIRNYYGIAIRSNIGNLEEMQRAVIAAFYHCCSGKSNPMHSQCPLGSESWCTYQRAQSAGKVFYDKNAGLLKSIINKIKPTYLQLCDQNLLRKCLHGKTQNANEAFNGCLWNVVPKEIFVELQTFSLGSYIAVITFNKGFKGLLSVLEALDIKIGSYTLRGYAAIDQTRIEDSKRHSLPSAKVTRKKIRAIKKRKVVNTEKHEGVTYKSGAF
ncbi:uncharacterized protein TNCV_922571 [Trichonephila clavipes]|nr:uncharacterized protein TNCV_922571 [Trichonephila clavipes]